MNRYCPISCVCGIIPFKGMSQSRTDAGDSADSWEASMECSVPGFVERRSLHDHAREQTTRRKHRRSARPRETFRQSIVRFPGLRVDDTFKALISGILAFFFCRACRLHLQWQQVCHCPRGTYWKGTPGKSKNGRRRQDSFGLRIRSDTSSCLATARKLLWDWRPLRDGFFFLLSPAELYAFCTAVFL